MLNPQMKSWGIYELTRRQAEELKQQREPEPRKTYWAPGSLEWQAEQEAKTKAQIEAAAVEGTAGSSASGPHSEARVRPGSRHGWGAVSQPKLIVVRERCDLCVDTKT